MQSFYCISTVIYCTKTFENRKRCINQTSEKQKKKVWKKPFTLKFKDSLLMSLIDIDLFTFQKNVSNIRLQESVSAGLHHVFGTVAPESSRI